MAESLEWPAARVRQTFFDYFAARGHTIGKFPDANMPQQPSGPASHFGCDATVN